MSAGTVNFGKLKRDWSEPYTTTTMVEPGRKAVISRVYTTPVCTPTAVHPDLRNGEVRIRTVRLMLENLVIHKVGRAHELRGRGNALKSFQSATSASRASLSVMGRGGRRGRCSPHMILLSASAISQSLTPVFDPTSGGMVITYQTYIVHTRRNDINITPTSGDEKSRGKCAWRRCS